MRALDHLIWYVTIYSFKIAHLILPLCTLALCNYLRMQEKERERQTKSKRDRKKERKKRVSE